MRVFAYCAANYVDATRRAAGVEPLVCPPVNADTLDLVLLENNDLIFFNLHSLPDAFALMGTRAGTPIALRADQLRGVDLCGAVVFAETCYLGEPRHPMRAALLDAGASCVIAGAGRNWGSVTSKLKGADLLGLWVRRAMAARLPADRALSLARLRLRASAVRSASARDALNFQLFRS